MTHPPHNRIRQIAAEVRPYVEGALLCLLVRAVEMYLGDQNGAYPRPTLYWAPVLLIIAQYGTLPGLMTAFVATFVLYTGRMPQQLLSDDFYSYWWRVGTVPMPWFIAATLLGELVMRHRRARDQTQRELDAALEREKIFLAAFEELETLKEQREKELAAITGSPAQIFKIFSQVDPKTQASVIDCTLELVRALLKPKKYSLYLLRGEELRLIRSQGWLELDPYQQQFTQEAPIYREVVTMKRPLSITEDRDRELLGDQGLVAVPLYDARSQKIFGMIKIESAEWSQITLAHQSTLQMAAQWAGSMLAYTQHFKVAYLTPTQSAAAELPLNKVRGVAK